MLESWCAGKPLGWLTSLLGAGKPLGWLENQTCLVQISFPDLLLLDSLVGQTCCGAGTGRHELFCDIFAMFLFTVCDAVTNT